MSTEKQKKSIPIVPPNFLTNPEFKCLKKDFDYGHYTAGWNVKEFGDIEIHPMKEGFNKQSSGNCVKIFPKKLFWQFIPLADLDIKLKKRRLKLKAEIRQKEPSSVKMSLKLVGPESSDGTWSPSEFGLTDIRVFYKHGRGELVIISEETSFSGRTDTEQLETEWLTIDWYFKKTRESSSEYRNVVGLQIQFENISSSPVWVRWPLLTTKKDTLLKLVKGRQIPSYSQKLPRTMKKLLNDQPIHILTLGSSIDRGSANPPLYLYDENPQSKTYKEPVPNSRFFLPETVGRPDLTGYIGYFQHYFMYTGRLRLELMRKFNLPVSRILLNVMACDGSSIGEGHTGFIEYSNLFSEPIPGINGHSEGYKWETLYPELFKKGKPSPDLIIFGYGSGHNEQIDEPDTVAAYEGAIRLFQRYHPNVEFLFCCWPVKKGKEDITTGPLKRLCSLYNIPFIDLRDFDRRLPKSTNFFALATDNVHFQAVGHYLWFKQLEKGFEITDFDQKWSNQKLLPKRMNKYSYNWEGDMVTFTAPHPRFVEGRMFILEDSAFNLWASHTPPETDPPTTMKIKINGTLMKDAGRGRNSMGRDIRNSAFAYGRLETGNRYVVEIIGTNPKIIATDNKVALNKTFFPADSKMWEKKVAIKEFKSEWGAPYGSKYFLLKEGESIDIQATGNLFSIAYIDEKDGGKFTVSVSNTKHQTEVEANVPYKCTNGNTYYMENRVPVTGGSYGKHKITIKTTGGTVRILGLYAYDTR
ncbi:SGNH/GDSL hydrolase family protein [bacterium]|nr:SGNH/GDSL hydrolase family protein [bacterium]